MMSSEVAGREGEGVLPACAIRDQASPKYPVNGTNGTATQGRRSRVDTEWAQELPGCGRHGWKPNLWVSY